MRDSTYCYWHHKAHARRRVHERIGGPISSEANSGLELPFLEDSNAIQVSIQEIMQAILDRRIDSKRAGLLLYSLQLASSNIRNLSPVPGDIGPQVTKIGDDDESRFNDTTEEDDRNNSFCDHDCHLCAEEDCDEREPEPIAAPKKLPPKIPPKIPPKPTPVRA